MTNKIFIFIISCGVALSALLWNDGRNDKIVGSIATSGTVPIPQVQPSRIYPVLGGTPIEDRSAKYIRYLAPSLKIEVDKGSGSGTICYYDPLKKIAYVATCGHLWSNKDEEGEQTALQMQQNPVNCEVITWYHNNQKLLKPKKYKAKVLFWSTKRGYDTGLVSFTPDWIPEYFPIAPLNYPINPGTRYHSTGCDRGSEVARYEVEIIGYRGQDLITNRNSPRPGRSGGGLLTEDGFYIATCWGTEEETGKGIGYFTPLKSIYPYWTKNGYGWLLTVVLAKDLPIYSHQGDRTYPKDYIVIPKRDFITVPN